MSTASAAASNRFDSIEYLRAFRDNKRFPAIHNDIFALIISECRGARFLDLCCSTGLLAERIWRFAGASYVLGVDRDAKALDAARAHGVTVPFHHLGMGPETFGELGAVIRENQISVVVARRCLPEILGPWPEYDRHFAAVLAEAGVAEVLLEGRVKTVRAVNRLAHVDLEAAALSSRYEVANRRGSCLRLTLRGSRPEESVSGAD